MDQSTSEGMTPTEFSSFVQTHGGLAGTTVLNPTMPDPKVKGLTHPNPFPQIKYVLKDGTELTARYDPSQGEEGVWLVTNPGTALKSSAPQTREPRIVRGPDGTLYRENPDGTLSVAQAGPGKALVSGANVTDPYLVVQNADGTISQQPNPNYDPLTAHLATARENWNQFVQAQNLALSEGKLSLDQYKTQLQERHDQLTDWLRQQQEGLQQQREEIGYADTLSKGLMPTGTAANIDKAIASLGSGSSAPVSYGPSGSLPTDLPMRLAAAALAHASPYAAQLIGRPPPTGFQAPPPLAGPGTPMPGAPTPPTAPPPAMGAPMSAGPSFVAPGPTVPPLSPVNQRIQAGLEPGG